MEVPVYNIQGQKVASLKVDEAALGGEVNADLVKQAYVRYHANTRQGSSKTKNRHEVEGSTRKLYKQKGTGNARHGDKKANLFKGGGHGHSKKKTREDFRLDMPKKMRRKANRNALLAKLVDNEVKVIDGWSGLTQPKTSLFAEMLGKLGVDKTALVALPMDASQAKVPMLGARNLEQVEVVRVDQLNAFTMLNNRFLVIARTDLEQWLTGPSSQTGKDAKVSPLGASKDEGTPARPAPKRGASARAEGKAPAKAPAKASSKVKAKA